jgi:hypothetical protein
LSSADWRSLRLRRAWGSSVVGLSAGCSSRAAGFRPGLPFAFSACPVLAAGSLGDGCAGLSSGWRFLLLRRLVVSSVLCFSEFAASRDASSSASPPLLRFCGRISVELSSSGSGPRAFGGRPLFFGANVEGSAWSAWDSASGSSASATDLRGRRRFFGAASGPAPAGALVGTSFGARSVAPSATRDAPGGRPRFGFWLGSPGACHRSVEFLPLKVKPYTHHGSNI